MKNAFINTCLAILCAFALAFALAASMNLDGDFTPPATQDALDAAVCAREGSECRELRPDDSALRDPRVQRTLRLLCNTGEKWACPLLQGSVL